MLARIKQALKETQGTVMLEFVASLMILLVIWAGICNFGLLLGERLAIASAAREAGREAAISGNPRIGIECGYRVLEAAGIGSGRSEVLVYEPSRNLFAVEVTCRSPVFLPLVNGLMGGRPFDSEITMHETNYFRAEGVSGG
jgi:hypothetical protein